MKAYNQFVTESYSARENIQEAIPLAIPAALKLASMGLGAYSAYSAAQKLKKGNYKGAALDALGTIPGGGAAFKAARGAGAGLNLARGASAATSVARWSSPARNRPIDKGIEMATDAITGTKRVTAKSVPDSSVTDTKPATPSNNTVADQKPKTINPKPSSVVLARKGGVQGKLDKATGKWTKGDWNKQESDRYKRVAALKTNK